MIEILMVDLILKLCVIVVEWDLDCVYLCVDGVIFYEVVV